ncbi:hypothetical protein I4641_20870 [Waterburya agarophytonicola K14]|uniref:DUF5648 domain-containing protein n=1 Tax=Waterburya agarophytonicola KI4 TaxID=2874699 RepID=A0A964BTK9_9CYAN|nr:hypothetical protein [Waterburya agarophytonicola]MCC0179418.1 hypothetical protein [Waterburya agarophytonicola KI4]
MTTNIIQTFETLPGNFVDADSFLFFTVDSQLWRTDGTQAGTINLIDPENNPNTLDENFSLNFDFNNNRNVIGIDGELFFAGSGEQNGIELYLSDGTAEGTRLLRDIDPEGSGNPRNFADVDGTLFFTVLDERNQDNLWVSDGTNDGTNLVRDFNVSQLAEEGIDGTLFFSGFDPDNADNSGLWRSDGTTEGTQLIFNIPNNQIDANEVAVAEDKIFLSFLGQLYISNGTSGGTRLLNDFAASNQRISPFTTVGDEIFFPVIDPEIGTELWKSDGTEEGTRLVRDIRPEERDNGTPVNEGSNPSDLIAVGETLFFTADSDGDNRRELWRSDGTTDGTNLVIDLFPEEGFSGGEDFIDVDGTLFFVRRNIDVDQIWQSDGTPEGTVPVEAEFLDENGEPLELLNADIFESGDLLYGTGGFRPEPGVSPTLGLFSISDEDNGGVVGQQPDNGSDDITGTTVYRFFNNNSGVHFYTANETERDVVLELDNFNFEGASYSSVDPLSGQPEPVPVYRFLNQDTGVHLYTVSDIERDAVQELDNFNFEGEAFFAYESEVDGSIPIYRFFNNTSGAHFYTPSAEERDSVETNLPEFALEGIAYYALPLEE